MESNDFEVCPDFMAATAALRTLKRRIQCVESFGPALWNGINQIDRTLLRFSIHPLPDRRAD